MGHRAGQHEPLAYNSLWQLRTDAWSSLEESAAQLVLAGAQHRPVEQLAETVSGLLDVLGPIERFWAFPGTQSFQKAAAAVRGGQVRPVRRRGEPGINRALATDSYRNGPPGTWPPTTTPSTTWPTRRSRSGRTGLTSRS